ncbi:MAG TPA: GAF domain-containing sensor histidine kinase [Anaerolineales bacterium]|nr:GAF domain-containing sensor histidine kinase [Anaerolineales bacterium]
MTKTQTPDVSGRSSVPNHPQLLRRYARLLEVSVELASTLDLDVLLQNVVEAARELTECEATSLLLHDSTTQHLHFEAATGVLLSRGERIIVPTENSIAGWVYSHGESLHVEDTVADNRFYPEVDVLTQFQTRSVLCVPLRTPDKTLGVIEAVNKVVPPFTEEDERLLLSLAAQAAIAIENASLFQQSDLVAEMVHELRTPLASLTAAAHLLKRTELPEEQRNRLADTVYMEVFRLNEMATDFLELARLESGRGRLVREPVHLGGLVQECIEIVRPQADADGITIESETDASLAPVPGDRNRLKQVFLNLLTNAIKYNQTGGTVHVRVSLEDGEAVTCIRDTGRGIPPESLPHIFERFYRVPEQGRSVGGTGLGLAIAKRIVDASHGRITVETQLGKGSTFCVRLPAGPATFPDTRPLRDAARAISPARGKPSSSRPG